MIPQIAEIQIIPVTLGRPDQFVFIFRTFFGIWCDQRNIDRLRPADIRQQMYIVSQKERILSSIISPDQFFVEVFLTELIHIKECFIFRFGFKMRFFLTRAIYRPVFIRHTAVRCDISHNKSCFVNIFQLIKKCVCNSQMYHPRRHIQSPSSGLRPPSPGGKAS